MGAERHILIVEDDAAIRATLVEVLAGEGYRVREASDGAEALAAVGAERPDLVVLDLHMPVMDGRTFVERLRAAEATRAVPVVLMTGATLAAEPVAGVSAVLVKPFRLEALVATVARLAGGG